MDGRIYMIKVGIVGVGRVGSSLAFAMLFHPKVSDIYLSDTNKIALGGEVEDLKQAAVILSKRKKIHQSSCLRMRDCDYIFIAAGKARFSSDCSMKELFKENYDLIRSITKRFTKENIYIITNPSDRLGKALALKWLGKKLDDTRKKTNGKSGPWILDHKGYTNWGIASEAYKVIK